VIFWEALTGQKMAVDDPRVHRFYRSIGCVFNHQSFFANVQQDDRVSNVSWDFEDEYMWKAMSRAMINTLQPANGVGYLMPSMSVTAADEEKMLEKILRDKIAGIRKNDGGNLNTSWDN
jgi:centrosomal protein CEP76